MGLRIPAAAAMVIVRDWLLAMVTDGTMVTVRAPVLQETEKGLPPPFEMEIFVVAIVAGMTVSLGKVRTIELPPEPPISAPSLIVLNPIE